MAKGDIETYWQGEKWHNKVQGEDEPSSTHDHKHEAVAEGRRMAIAAKVEHVIKNQDGTIGEKNTYGHDPRDIPG
jgi:hypothetical protein